jgi:DNA-binding NtrC family response regulator
MAPTRLLVIDDDVPLCRLLSKNLTRLGFSPHFASLLESGLQRLQSEDFDVILLDPQRAGMHLPHDWTAVREVAPQTAVVIATRPATISMAVACMRLGATDFLQKPLTSVSHAASRLHAAAATSTRPRLRACRPSQPDEHGILTASPLFLDLLDRADRLADSDLPVLKGESGTGKDLIARRMHARSPRRDGPWVPVNCAALPDSLADAELFGHTRDAFTGAAHRRKGLLCNAHGGTLFLDEVGELSPRTQARLLRTLQEGEVRPLGQSSRQKIDVRVLAASNRNLRQTVGTGTFREDLYHRLAASVLTVPPLRDRPEDLSLLALHFLALFASERGHAPPVVEPAAMECLLRHPWPGNVRELRNGVQAAVVLAGDGSLRPEHLPPPLRNRDPRAPAAPLPGSSLKGEEGLTILRVMADAGGCASLAARRLGVSRSTLYRKLRSLDSTVSSRAVGDDGAGQHDLWRGGGAPASAPRSIGQ